VVREGDVDKRAAPARDGAPFSWGERGRSFVHAFRGVATLLAAQHNARIHAAMTLAVVVLGALLGVAPLEWAVLALAIGLVWACEAFNSALEWLCDVASPEFHPLVRKAKDVAAAGVLLAAVAAGAAGLLVFLPHLLRVVHGLP
jgi:diacylglycerol kinase